MRNVRIFTLMIVAVGVIAGVMIASDEALATDSANSTFSQVIRQIDCSHTVYDRAVGQVNDVECDVFAPKYERSTIKDNGYPIIYGVYDAIHAVVDPVTSAHRLEVEFAGRKFVLGVDPELTVNGNAWILDLSNWPSNHPGDTTLALERGKTYPGKVTATVQPHSSPHQVTHTTNFTITIPEKATSPDASANNGVTGVVNMIGRSLANTGASIWLFVSIALGLIAVAFGLLIYKKRRKQS